MSEPTNPDQLEQHVALIREHLTEVVSEPDYRTPAPSDWGGLATQNAGLLAGLLALVGGAAGLWVWNRHRRRLRLQLRYESLAHRALTAAAGAAAGVFFTRKRVQEPQESGS